MHMCIIMCIIMCMIVYTYTINQPLVLMHECYWWRNLQIIKAYTLRHDVKNAKLIIHNLLFLAHFPAVGECEAMNCLELLWKPLVETWLLFSRHLKFESGGALPPHFQIWGGLSSPCPPLFRHLYTILSLYKCRHSSMNALADKAHKQGMPHICTP